MKKKFKLLAIILTVLITVLCLPVNALASDISDPEENSSTEVSSEASESSVETTVETETMIFEFTEDEAPPINSRMIGGGGEVDFGPPEEETTTRLSDGVYAIENFIYPGIWMDATASSSAGAALRQSSYTESPLVSFTRSALFKIRYVSETNSYIIRLMTNNLLSIEKNSNYFYTTSISPYDKDHEDKVSALETFTITYSNGGYIISPYNNQSYAICSNGSVAGDSNGSSAYLRYQLKSTAGNNARWKFHKYTGAHKNGTILYYTSSWKSVGIPVGTTGTMSCKTWTTKIGANTPYKRVAADSSAMISTSFNFETNKMSFEALSPGKAKIYSMILEGNSEPSKYTVYSYFQVIPQEGTYSIRNVGTKKFIGIDGHYNTEENARIKQFNYGDADWLRWTVEHVSGGEGYVRIKSHYSNKYISVDSTDNSVIKQTSAQNDYNLWKFERTSAGNVKLVCKALAATHVLAPPSASSGNGAALKMVTYTDDTTYNDEWKFPQKPYYAYVINHYDMGFVARYGGSSSVVASKIDTYMDAVAERFLELLDLVLISSNATYYQSPLDICKGTVSSSNIDNLCSHDGVIHSERSNVISDFNATHIGDSITTHVLWSGHKITSQAPSGETNYNRSCSSGTGVFLLEISTSNIDRNLQGVLMHELCHQFGARDHYHEPTVPGEDDTCRNKSICSECEINPRDESCIMNQSRRDISDDAVLCSECLNDILNHLISHH